MGFINQLITGGHHPVRNPICLTKSREPTRCTLYQLRDLLLAKSCLPIQLNSKSHTTKKLSISTTSATTVLYKIPHCQRILGIVCLYSNVSLYLEYCHSNGSKLTSPQCCKGSPSWNVADITPYSACDLGGISATHPGTSSSWATLL